MKKKIELTILFILASCSFFLVNTTVVFSEDNKSEITIVFHEEENDSTSIQGNRSVSVYDMTAIYLEEKKDADFSDKQFSEKWSAKALKSEDGLPNIIKNGMTDSNGEWTVTLPLYSGDNFAVYLIKETGNTQSLRLLPSVIILPVYSTETGEMLTTIDVYPKYLEGEEPLKPTEPTPLKPTEPTQNSPHSFGTFPSTNEMRTNTIWIGIGIIAFTSIFILFRNKKNRGEK